MSEIDEFQGLLREATARIPANYIQLPVAGQENPIYRERVYCYELYHQLRQLWPPVLSQFSLDELIVVGQLNLGGSIEPVYNALEKAAQMLLMPVSACKQLFDLPDDMVTKVNIQYYTDAQDALVKALAE